MGWKSIQANGESGAALGERMGECGSECCWKETKDV